MMIIINWFRKKYCWTEHYLPYLLSFPFRNHWGKTIVCHQNHRSIRTYFSLKSFRILASKTNVALLKPTRTIFEETSSTSITKTLLLPSSSNENVKTSETVNTHEFRKPERLRLTHARRFAECILSTAEYDTYCLSANQNCQNVAKNSINRNAIYRKHT